MADSTCWQILNHAPRRMMVDAGPQGIGRSGHGHADALSVRLTMAGRRWLVDSGSGVYISNDPADRNAFRGTGAHNTMRVDALDQAVPSSHSHGQKSPTPKTEDWIAGKTFTYFVGSHDGFLRLADPVLIDATSSKSPEGLWLVRDIALGRAEHDLKCAGTSRPTWKFNLLVLSDQKESESSVLGVVSWRVRRCP